VIRLKLKELLEAHGVSAYALGKAVEGISPKTIYMYVNGQRQPSLGAVATLLHSLRELTGENIQLCELLEYKET
jgi:DNA-binding XRE family transcriptional regulator